MAELTANQVRCLIDLVQQIGVAMGELRDAAATTYMHDAKAATRSLHRLIQDDDVLPDDVRERLTGPLADAWSRSVTVGRLFERTHGAIKHLSEADQYACDLLAQGTMH